MKKIFITTCFILASVLSWAENNIVSPEELTVPIEIYRESDDSFVMNGTMRLFVVDPQDQGLTIQIPTWPNEQYGLLFSFCPASDATYQIIVSKDVTGYILSSQLKPSWPRYFVEISEDNNGGHYMYFYKREGNGDPQYRDYYIKMTPDNEWKVRLFWVEWGNYYKLFRQLEKIELN